MRKKPEAWLYEDGDGAFALYCKNREQALKAFQTVVDEEVNPKFTVKMEDIRESIAYHGHRKCNGGWSIGESICWECGESGNWAGVSCFTLQFYQS